MNNEDTRKFLEQFKQDYIDGVNSDVDSIIEATECLLATGQWLPIHQGILQTIDELIESTKKDYRVDINFDKYCFLNQTKHFKEYDNKW